MDTLDFSKNDKELQKMKKAELIEYIKILQEKYEELKNVQKIKNERGAGRKKKYTDEQVEEILEARKQSKSIRAIAKEFGFSTGLVHKIISERS